MSKYHVFLSYNSRNIASAQRIFEELGNRGIRVWFDKTEISTGDDVQECLEQGLSESQAIVILIGECVGPWQSLEVKDGIREYVYKARPLFPVLLKGAVEDEIPNFISTDFHGNRPANQLAASSQYGNRMGFLAFVTQQRFLGVSTGVP